MSEAQTPCLPSLAPETRGPGRRGSRSGESPAPLPPPEGVRGRPPDPNQASEQEPTRTVGTAPSPGTPPHGFHSEPLPSAVSHLSLWLRQQLQLCLLKCGLTCLFYKFLGFTIDFLTEDFESLSVRLLRLPCCSNNALSFLISPICDTLFTSRCRGLAPTRPPGRGHCCGGLTPPSPHLETTAGSLTPGKGPEVASWGHPMYFYPFIAQTFC